MPFGQGSVCLHLLMHRPRSAKLGSFVQARMHGLVNGSTGGLLLRLNGG